MFLSCFFADFDDVEICISDDVVSAKFADDYIAVGTINTPDQQAQMQTCVDVIAMHISALNLMKRNVPTNIYTEPSRPANFGNPISVNQNDIRQENHLKYLGLFTDLKLSWSRNRTEMISEDNAARAILVI